MKKKMWYKTMYYLDDGPTHKVMAIPLYFKTMEEVKKWFCMDDSVDADYLGSAVDAAEISDVITGMFWHVKIDNEVECYVHFVDLVAYMGYLNSYGHKINITNKPET